MINPVTTIPSMTPTAIDRVRRLERLSGEMPQVSIETLHTFHAGMYARTVRVPAGVLITGALIKIATVLIVSGDAIMYGDGGAVEISGYNVLSASANRKQAFLALTDTYLTMLFPSEAKSIDEAECEFTDEIDLLASRRDDAGNTVNPCLA